MPEKEPTQNAPETPIEKPVETPVAPTEQVKSESQEKKDELSHDVESTSQTQEEQRAEQNLNDAATTESDEKKQGKNPEEQKTPGKWDQMKNMAEKAVEGAGFAAGKALEVFQSFMEKLAKMGAPALRSFASVLRMFGANHFAEVIDTIAGTDGALLFEQAKKLNIEIKPTQMDAQYMEKIRDVYRKLTTTGGVTEKDFTKTQFYEAVVKNVQIKPDGITLEDVLKSASNVRPPAPQKTT